MGITFGALIASSAATGAGVAMGPNQKDSRKTFHVQVSGSGAVSTTALILGSNINSSLALGNWVTLATVTISGTTVISDGFVAESPWRWYRGQVFAIAGASAIVDIIVGDGSGS